MKKKIIAVGALLGISAGLLAQDSLRVGQEFHGKESGIDEVTITGTLKPMKKSQSPVPIEVYSPKFLQKSPSPSLFEAVSLINGIRPQVNCSVCNTGEIKINGLDGAYTMVLIDGMPIVSALSTVYGLNGIPNNMIERVEVVKGPAASLYGSEAMGGMINIITKNAFSAPKFTADIYGTTWAEANADLGTKFNINEKISSLLSLNYYHFNERIDDNKDNFTDMTLQKRASLFNKWNFQRKEGRQASVALRYMYEDRFGGEMQWDRAKHRGGDEAYGESIFTNRVEVIGAYQLPMEERIFTQFSYNYHHQDSYYGTEAYMAKQHIAFGQAYWNPTFGNHDLLIGTGLRYNFYDDNTVGTLSVDGKTNTPQNTYMPGIFVQDQWKISPANTLLLGYRLDHHNTHKLIHSPRVAWKSQLGGHSVRASFGTGFRVVNLFTEDHKALTGAREVVITEELKPEKSVNFSLNHIYKIMLGNGSINFDTSAFYSRFSNKIIGDFETNDNKIIYSNLNGFAENRGLSTNIDWTLGRRWRASVGVTYMEVFRKEDGEKITQLHAPKWSGTYAITGNFANDLSVDFTGQFYGPMRLPILENDFRPEYSPWYSIANIKVAKKISKNLELYAGVKNLLNFKPKNPIMRAFDPFDKTANDPITNPNGYTFDPEYGYASMQGIRGFLGINYKL